MTDYALVLSALHPDALWELDGNDYANLVWHGPGERPSQESLDAAWPVVDHDVRVGEVQAARQARYRREADPLFFEAQRGEDGVTLADWEAKVAEIKAALPYPTL